MNEHTSPRNTAESLRLSTTVPSPNKPGYGELARVFLRLSLLGFGGPNAHIALMLDDVVERRAGSARSTSSNS